MNYVIPNARFLFFNGQKRYTVQYEFGLQLWWVFNEYESAEEFNKSIYTHKEVLTVKDNILYKAEQVFYDFLSKQTPTV